MSERKKRACLYAVDVARGVAEAYNSRGEQRAFYEFTVESRNGDDDIVYAEGYERNQYGDLEFFVYAPSGGGRSVGIYPTNEWIKARATGVALVKREDLL